MSEADEMVDKRAGDLIVIVQERAHPTFKRKGADLFFTAPVTVRAAAYGDFKVSFKHPSGSERMIHVTAADAPLRYTVTNPLSGEDAKRFTTSKQIPGLGLRYMAPKILPGEGMPVLARNGSFGSQPQPQSQPQSQPQPSSQRGALCIVFEVPTPSAQELASDEALRVAWGLLTGQTVPVSAAATIDSKSPAHAVGTGVAQASPTTGTGTGSGTGSAKR